MKTFLRGELCGTAIFVCLRKMVRTEWHGLMSVSKRLLCISELLTSSQNEARFDL